MRIPWKYWKIVDSRAHDARENQMRMAVKYAAIYKQRDQDSRKMFTVMLVIAIIIIGLAALKAFNENTK